MMDSTSFLIGDGSARLMHSYNETESFAQQLIAEDNVTASLEVYDDIRDCIDHKLKVSVTTRQEIDWIFYKYKKEVYDIFGYTELKSAWMQGVPMKVEDLVVDDADKYLIDYLVNTETDLYTWKQLAKLQACANMGISYVRFITEHDCPICKATNGKIISVENLTRLLCRSGHVTHAICPCDIVPVLYREKHEGVLAGHSDEEIITWGVHDALHVPKELLVNTELHDLVADMPWLEVDFVNMSEWCIQNIIGSPKGLVVHAEDETLYVHNSYVGMLTPVDYLRSFLANDVVCDKLDKDAIRSAPSFWLDGKLVVKVNDHYYNENTGGRMKRDV